MTMTLPYALTHTSPQADISVDPAKNSELIEETWREVGQRVRPLRKVVFVRTELLPEYDGHIYLPPAQRTNYAQLPHKVLMRALVLATGPECRHVRPGEKVAFSRLFLARWHALADGTLVGWVNDEDNIAGKVIGTDPKVS